MMQSLIVVSCLLLALSTQGAPLASNKSNGTMTKRSSYGHTMVVDSDVHDNIMNSRQDAEAASGAMGPPTRRAFHINGGTTSDNVVNIRPSKTGDQAMSQQDSTKSKGFYIDGKPLVVNGADGSRTLNPALSADKSPAKGNSARMTNEQRMSHRESVDDDNTTETPVKVDSRNFLIENSNVYKNQMNSRQSIDDDDDTTETPVKLGSRDFHIDHSNVYKNQMNSRQNIDDDDDTTETPVKLGSRDFHIDHSNVYKNQMNSRRSVDERDTTESPVVTGSRDFHFSNNNMFDNKNTTHTKLDTPPLPKDAPK